MLSIVRYLAGMSSIVRYLASINSSANEFMKDHIFELRRKI